MKEKKNLLKNLIFIGLILLIISEITQHYSNIGNFSDIARISELMAFPTIIICAGQLISTQENKNRIIRNGLLCYFVLQIINGLVIICTDVLAVNYFAFVPYSLNWIFIAIPIYTLILDKYANYKYIFHISLLTALLLAVDGGITSELICLVVSYFPLFIIGWNLDNKNKKSRININVIIRILLIAFLLIIYFNLDYTHLMIDTVKTTDEGTSTAFLKIILYATTVLFVTTIIDLFSKVKLFNKSYKINIKNVFIGWSITNQILYALPYEKLMTNNLSIIIVIATSIVLSLIFGLIPFYKTQDYVVTKRNKRKAKKENVEVKDIAKNKSKISKLLNSSAIIVILGILLLLKAIMFYKNTVYANRVIPLYEIWFNVSFILVVLIPIILMNNNKMRFILVIIWDLIISTILFADELYYAYSSIVISVNQFGNVRYVNEILNTVKDLLNIRQVLYFVDIIVLLIMLKITKLKNLTKGTAERFVKNLIISIFIIYMCSENIVYMSTLILTSPYNNEFQVSEGTIFGYHINDMIKFFNIKGSLKYKTKEAVNHAYNSLLEYYDENITEQYQGIAQNKNIILLQLESVQEFVYGMKINGKEVTPNLNKFLDENIHITNMHSQSYTTTADSEFAAITSLYPLENGLSFSKYYNAEYDDIFTIMTQNNYYTSYMHGNNGSFWNREKVFSFFDINETNFLNKFDDQSEMIMGYLSDELLYRQAVEKIKNYKSPFFVNIISASSHTGFTLDGMKKDKKDVLTIDVGDYKDTRFGNYLESVNYADIQFGYFIDLLKENNLYDDTVIIVYGDHYGVSLDDEDMLKFFESQGNKLNSIQQKLNFTRVLAGAKIPGIESTTIDIPTSKIDIKPTVLSLVGLDSQMSLGKSIFSTKDYACTNEGTIITKDKYYDSQNWYNIDDGSLVNMDELDEEEINKLRKYEENMKIELEISKSVPILNKK